jgi:hypothetical protein
MFLIFYFLGTAMKLLFISILSIIINIHLFSQPSRDSIFITISSDTIHIWNTGVSENCGCLFRMDASISHDTVYITEVDTASDWAFCTCTYNLCATLTGLQSGTYFVKVYRKMPLFYPDTLFYIGSTSFIYGGSALPFFSQSYQSECYNISEVEEYKGYPKEFTLEQNYPNPFNPITIISYQLPISGYTTLKVFNMLGSEIETLVNEYKLAGYYKIIWNAVNQSSGVYFYQLRIQELKVAKKMVLLR